ncbi:MAG: RNA methyltransferase [Tissierellia bacterium]|nr:RNA methyltransferase [Tissierellia bacterium]
MKNNIIESKDNAQLKKIRKLRQKKYRYKERKFVIESKKLLIEALENGVDIDFILVRQDVSDDFDGYDLKICSPDIFNSISQMVSPDGYLAVANFPDVHVGASDRILLLDHISDPGNLGTIIRSAEAFSFNTIYLLNTVDPYNEKTLRASMGSIFRLKLVDLAQEDLGNLAEKYTFYIGDMKGKDYKKEAFAGPVCLIIGNEANGISDEIRKLADKAIKIPMSGRIESLNAAISASILMSEIQSKKSNLLEGLD